MDSDSWLLLFLLLALILGGGYFASAETAFAASSKIKIKNRSDNGDRRAKNALYVLEHFDKVLSTLLIGNNIMHIGTASIATYLVTKLWGTSYVTYSTLLTTVVVFLVSEMIPKQFAKDKSESVALFYAGSVRFLMKILTPISFVFDSIGRLASKLFKSEHVPSISEEDLYEIIETMVDDRAVENERGQLIHSALLFDDTTVQEILTPRISIIGIDISMSHEEVMKIIYGNKHTRLPVYKKTLDNIVGILSIRRYIKASLLQNSQPAIADLMHKPYFVPKNKQIDELAREMSQLQVHMSVVTDDYGGTMGIVTMEDVLEELIGEIWDEDDVVHNDFLCVGDNRYEISGDMNIKDALELLDLSDYAEDLSAMTAGAWSQENIKGMPKRGSEFKSGVLTVRVLEIDSRQHIQKLLFEISVNENEQTASQEARFTTATKFSTLLSKEVDS
jgi:CBS domain containing-hemolysin-like protein